MEQGLALTAEARRPMPKVNMPVTGIASFCKFPICDDLDTVKADVAILGMPWDWGVGFRPGTRFGPRAVREFSTRYAFYESGMTTVPGYYDIDLGKRLLTDVSIVDCGDVDILYTDIEYSFRVLRETIRQVIRHGAMPVLIGGDHSITFPFVEALAGKGPLGIVQIDAHLDYHDSLFGVRLANGNSMKRISELPYIGPIAQIGMKGVRVREENLRDSLARGNLVISARELRRIGPEVAIARVPQSERYFVTIDFDALDPAIAPGIGSPEVGGMNYEELRGLLRAMARKGKIVGFDLCEVNPMVDPTGLTASTAAQTILEFLGAIFER